MEKKNKGAKAYNIVYLDLDNVKDNVIVSSNKLESKLDKLADEGYIIKSIMIVAW